MSVADHPDDWPSHLAHQVSSTRGLEPWANHLRLRMIEMERIANALDLRGRKLLEIGCGNGFGSAYLAQSFQEVVASDLPDEAAATHSIGLGRTASLFRAAGLSNAAVVGCSGEQLPFEDETFDAVLALYSLEHIPDRQSCLRETHRVLKQGGVLIAAVPTSAWSATYPLVFYGGLARRVIARILRRVRPPGGHQDEAAEAKEPRVTNWTSFRQAYPHFPRPTPHGAYSSWLKELWGQRPSRWLTLCRAAGFQFNDALPLSVMPQAIFSTLFGAWGMKLYEALLPFDRLLCRRKWAAWMAQSLVLVCRKQEGENGTL